MNVELTLMTSKQRKTWPKTLKKDLDSKPTYKITWIKESQVLSIFRNGVPQEIIETPFLDTQQSLLDMLQDLEDLLSTQTQDALGSQ